MFALRNAIYRTVPLTSRRFVATVPLPKQPCVPEVYNYSFKKAFLNDPACYPILAITAFLCTFLVGATTRQALTLKDLRVRSQYKHEPLQQWGNEHRVTATSYFASGPMIMHGEEHRSTWQEGLGVNHEEWLKQKAAKDAEQYHN